MRRIAALLAHGIPELPASESVFPRALAIRDLVLPPDHLLLAETLEGYAALLQDMNRTGEAKELESRAESIRTAK